MILYQNFLSSWKFRNALIFSIIIRSLASVVDLVIVMRWNIVFGVPDKLLFVWGHATFENLVIILQSITLSSIYAKIAPPSMETSGFGETAIYMCADGSSLSFFNLNSCMSLPFSLLCWNRHVLLYYNKCSWIWHHQVEWHENSRRRL